MPYISILFPVFDDEMLRRLSKKFPGKPCRIPGEWVISGRCVTGVLRRGAGRCQGLSRVEPPHRVSQA